MTKLIPLLMVVLFMSGCVSSRSHPEKYLLKSNDLTSMAAMASESKMGYARVIYKGFSRGSLDTDLSEETDASSTNDPTLAAVSLGAQIQSSAAARNGWLDRAVKELARPFSLLSSKGTDDEVLAVEGLGDEGIQAVITAISVVGKQPDMALFNMVSKNKNSTSFDPEVAESLSKDNLSALTNSYRLKNTALQDKIKELNDQLEAVKSLRETLPNNGGTPTPKPPTDTGTDTPEDTSGVPGGNPNNAKLGGGNDQAPSRSFLWKPQRDGTVGEAALLLPYTIRAKSITVNGKKPKLNSISNGYRETYYLKRPSGSVEIIVKGYDGKTYKRTLPDASKRVDGGGLEQVASVAIEAPPTSFDFANSPNTWGISADTMRAAVPAAEVARNKRVPPMSGKKSNLIMANRDASGHWEANHTLYPSGEDLLPDGRKIYYIPQEVNLKQVMLKVRWGKPALEHDHSSGMDFSKSGEYTPNLRQWNGR